MDNPDQQLEQFLQLHPDIEIFEVLLHDLNDSAGKCAADR